MSTLAQHVTTTLPPTTEFIKAWTDNVTSAICVYQIHKQIDTVINEIENYCKAIIMKL